MHDNDIQSGQFQEIEDAMKQGFTAVNDDLEPEFVNVRASVARASGGAAQFAHLFAEQTKERE